MLHVDHSGAGPGLVEGGILCPEKPTLCDESEDHVCAICFESGFFVSLPCRCQTNYCASCWDRSLATSVVVRGRAQCPTCRTAFRVDVDSVSHCGHLVPVLVADSSGTNSTEWRSHLYSKARPVQINLLRTYGEAVAARTEAQGFDPVGKSEQDAYRGEVAPSRVSSEPAEMSGPVAFAGEPEDSLKPSCVCGASLERVTRRTRILRMMEDTDPGWQQSLGDPEGFLDRMTSSALVTCDLCDSVATSSGAVWTCQNGTHTVLHPASYDVCEKCFGLHSGFGRSQANQEKLQGLSSGRASISCCQASAGAVLAALPRPWLRRLRTAEAPRIFSDPSWLRRRADNFMSRIPSMSAIR